MVSTSQELLAAQIKAVPCDRTREIGGFFEELLTVDARD